MSIFRAIFVAVAVLWPITCIGGAAARPNVLWICADDHAAYVMGAYGNRQLHTPNLDRLAAEGMRFDRAYCNSPVCTASRQSFLTGRYPRTIGVTQLSTPLPESEITLAELLKDAGYATASIGKMHFNSALKHGFDLRIDDAEFAAALKQKGRTPFDAKIPVLPQWRPFRDPARVWLNGFHRPYGAIDADMQGTFFAQQATEYLSARRDVPFFLMVSFYEPHSPFRYPIEYRDRHDPAGFAVPQPGPEDDNQVPAIFRELTDADKQGIAASYYTSVEFMDKNVGLVLEALERSGHGDDTVVVYTGDHGYLLGQHGRFEKHSSYEEAVRSPLLLKVPRVTRPGSSTRALVELIDVVPTILEACGRQIPPTVQGRSLGPLLKGETDRHRDQVFVEYAPNDELMVRDEQWKLVFERGKRRRTDGYDHGETLPGHTVRLFDLDKDPSELHNLARDPDQAARIERYVNSLVDHLKRTSRRAEFVPQSDDSFEILDACVQPRDVGAK
ncbi:MAG: sulfatase-like hydrolase/transferase [Planctomycetaceae bacterium]